MSLVSGPSRGKLALDGSFTYKMAKKFKGVAFVYEVTDVDGNTTMATISKG